MNRQLRTLGLAFLGSVAALLPVGVWADTVLHARVSFDAGGSMVMGTADSDWSHATVNTLVLPGDTLWVDQGGTSEIEFSGGSFLRMADGSKAEVSTIAPSITVRGWDGSFYVQRVARSTGDFVFVSPSATVQIDQDSSVRIDIVNQATTVSVRWGRATIRTDVGSPVQASTGERVWVDPGLLPSNPAPFDRNREDGFDVWNRERAELLARGYETVPKEVISTPVIGSSDLGAYGDWVRIDNRQYWRPTVVTNYVPYRYGHWSYVNNVGYNWVGHYPFSYVTSHYGRWAHYPTYGWVWSYDPVWSPAWAATVRVGDYLMWTPVDYYYRPVYSVSGSYFSIGGVSFSIFASSYAPISHIHLGSRYVYGVNPGFGTYINNNYGNVYIWNININNRPHVRVPYDRNLDQVRVYNPRRSIRGPISYGADSVLASQRVRQLESRIGRDAFSAIDRTGRAGVRTDVAAMRDRTDRVRNVRVAQDMPSYTRATSRNPEDAAVAANRTGRVPRSRDIGATDDVMRAPGLRTGETSPERGAAARRDGASTGGRTPADTARGVRGEGTGTTPGRAAVQPDRGVRGGADSSSRTPAPATDRIRRVEDADRTVPGADRTRTGTASTPSQTRTPADRGVTGRGDAPARTPAETSRGIRGTDTPGRTPAGTATDRTPLRAPEAVRRSGGSAPSSEVTRTPVRSGPPSVTTPDQPRVTSPGVRSGGGAAPRSSATAERTPTRSGPPSVSAPDRSLSPERTPRVIAPQSRTTPQSTTAPRASQAPRVQQSTPSRTTVRQSTPQAQPSAPQSAPRIERPAPPARSAPQVQQSAPQVQRSAPQVQRSAPQVQRSAPQVQRSGPQVQQSAPQIQRSAPQVQRSAPQVQRSAPQVQRSAPQISQPAPRAPEVSRSAPSITRPSAPAPSTGVRGGTDTGRSVRQR